MQPEAAVVQIEKVVTAAGFFAQDVAVPSVNLLADRESLPLKSDLAQESFSLFSALDPHVTLALTVVTKAIVGNTHAVIFQKIEPFRF